MDESGIGPYKLCLTNNKSLLMTVVVGATFNNGQVAVKPTDVDDREISRVYSGALRPTVERHDARRQSRVP